MKPPFAVPADLSPDLTRVQAYWTGLLRGAATMPFWDDCRLTDLPDLTGRLFLVNVFSDPERFRFDRVGRDIGGSELEGLFLDETRLTWPFEYLRAQSSTAVEASAPTYFGWKGEAGPAYSRLVLPMWGDGRVSMLLGVIERS